jgi:hypothetical protein
LRSLTIEASQPGAEKACLLTPEDGARRQADIDSLFANAVQNRPIDEGQVLTLKGNPDELWPRVLGFIEEERLCCPFFSFHAQELADGVELTITGARLTEVREQ